MLDLEARVHLEEEELTALVVDQELDRARRRVVERAREPQRRVAHALAQRELDARGGRLLDDLLMPALDRALALAQVHEVAVAIAEDLDLDVTRARHVALEEHAIVSESAGRLAPRGRDRLGELALRVHDPHALAAAARDRLHQQRITNRIPRSGIARPGEQGHAHLLGERLRGELVAHALDRGGRRSDPDQSCRRHIGRERGVLRQEAVAGMDRARTARARSVEDRLAVEVGRGQPDRLVRIGDVRRRRVGIDVHRDAADPHRARAAEHARAISPRFATSSGRKLTAGTLRSRARPRPALLRTTERQMPSAVRVSRGSRMPSSLIAPLASSAIEPFSCTASTAARIFASPPRRTARPCARPGRGARSTSRPRSACRPSRRSSRSAR
jgi:hypothetical protein